MAPKPRSANSQPVLPPGRHPDFDLDQTIQGMPTTFIQCRDFNHSWRPFTATWNPTYKVYEVQLRCARCKTIRERRIGQDGSLVGSKYEYVDGYVVKGMGRITGVERNVLRLQSILRILPEDTADENAG